jgi:hypothetical protein
MSSADESLIKICLWGLSNLLVVDEDIRMFYGNGELVSDVLKVMACHENFQLATEAGFVITNCIT